MAYTRLDPDIPRFDDWDELKLLLFRQRDVIGRAQALRFLSPKAIQHRLQSGRWRAVHRGVYLVGGATLNDEQRRWVAVLATGAALAGVSALAQLGLRGYRNDSVHVLLPAGRKDRDPPWFVRVHRTRQLPDEDLLTWRQPLATTAARAVVDAGQWADTDERARAIVAASFQQRLVTFDEVQRVLDRLPRARRRAVLVHAIADAAGGAHSLSESDFTRLCRRAGLPVPTRQVRRADRTGRIRYLDAYFEPWQVHVEIDGGQHMEVTTWWADMKRQNELWISGDRVLRFPAWAIRHRPREVVAQVRAALTAAGWHP